MIVLENKIFTIGFSEKNGSIVLLVDPVRELNYVHKEINDPFLVETDRKTTPEFTEFSWRKTGNALDLQWIRQDWYTVHASIKLTSSGLDFSCNIKNESDLTIISLEYPIIGGIMKTGHDDHLIHSYATGFMVDDPFTSFPNEGDGLRYMPYPESFSGASMQFFAYYGNKGGLYFAALDPGMHQKWLNFYKHADYLQATHIFGYEDLHPGNDLILPYVFHVRPFSGDWTDAAKIYKEYATGNYSFLPKTTCLRKHPEWLYKKVGVTTFGINAKHDRSLWLNQYHKDIGTPIFHILGPDWTHEPQTFRRGIPGPIEEWIPTRFNKHNLETIHKNNDYFAPFEFDFYVREHPEYSDHVMHFPKHPKSHDMYHFNMLCPTEPYTREMHVKRDLAVYEEVKPDAFYYDISANNLIKTCMADNHHHHVGGGHEIASAYKNIYRETVNELEKAAGKPIPIGTEMMNEIHLSEIEFYQARANANPASTLELWPFRDLVNANHARIIPLFSFVYHEYGAIRIDGWGKLVKEIGDLFFYTVAITYLWGGIYEINHEYSPMEAINGKETLNEEHYATFAARGYNYCKARGQYLRQFAAMRTKEGNPYLAYGVMLKPPQVNAGKTTLNWYHYNHWEFDPSYNSHGKYVVDSIQRSAYRYVADANKIAIFLVNVSNQEQHFDIDIDQYLSTFNMSATITCLSGFDPERETSSADMGTVIAGRNTILKLNLLAHQTIMLRIELLQEEQ